MRCNIDDTLAARGTATPQDEENARRGRKREKEKDTRGASPTRKCRRHRIERDNYVFRESTELHYRGVMDCRIAIDAGAKREKERQGRAFETLSPVLPFSITFSIDR